MATHGPGSGDGEKEGGRGLLENKMLVEFFMLFGNCGLTAVLFALGSKIQYKRQSSNHLIYPAARGCFLLTVLFAG